MKIYKLGKVIFKYDSENDRYFSYRGSGLYFVFKESDLLEMGAQLVEEDKPQEIEEISYESWESAYACDRSVLLLNKQKEIIRAFNTHLSACGKEK